METIGKISVAVGAYCAISTNARYQVFDFRGLLKVSVVYGFRFTGLGLRFFLKPPKSRKP